MRARYAALWRVPGAPLLLAGGVVARLGQGVTVLAWILLVRETTGSFAAASLVAASVSLATAAAAPVAGRLTDRFGATRVLPAYGATYATAQLLLLAAVLTRQPLLLLCVLAALSGAAFPATSPALRAAWAVLTGEGTGRERVRSTAMAAESTLFELVFVVGPLLLSAAMLVAGPLATLTGSKPGVAGPTAAIVLAAVCAAGGTAMLARGRAMRALRPDGTATPTRGLGPLRSPRMPALLACAAGVAFSFGASPVAVAAFAVEHDGAHAEAVTGALIAVWSLGSAAAGLWYGARTWTTPLTRQLVWLLAGLAVGYAAWALSPNSVVLGVVLLLSGAVIAPAMTVQAGLMARIAPPSMLTEAYTWLTTVNLSLAALGSAVTGAIVDGPAGAAGGFLACAAAAGAAAVLAAWPGVLAPRRSPAAVDQPADALHVP
ncbi:Major Facilitator Superfamily protein [Micromonospora nigra]|uniref:Major Facilitator Superfamily protein n=1 Tax=Micromonospora nigra TaxID=145857 RepID=A0A1C6R8W6_9ACTN|nr:MFS transporter [Micromonospora nigra]SCL13542.1 Major Facilitator Superfamily protein [Micromonospora nigra]